MFYIIFLKIPSDAKFNLSSFFNSKDKFVAVLKNKPIIVTEWRIAINDFCAQGVHVWRSEFRVQF